MSKQSMPHGPAGPAKFALPAIHILAAFGCVVLALLLALICTNIALRPFGENIRGVNDLAGYLGAAALGCALPLTQLKGGHISGGLWGKVLPAHIQQALQLLCNAFGAVLLGFAAFELYSIAEFAVEMEEYIDGFPFTYALMALLAAIGLLLHTLIVCGGAGKMLFSRRAK